MESSWLAKSQHQQRSPKIPYKYELPAIQINLNEKTTV